MTELNKKSIAEKIAKFADYLSNTKGSEPSRNYVLSFALVSSSFEKWLQFELGAWLSVKTEWVVLLEHAGQTGKHIDIWIENKDGQNAAVEMKLVYNNKNFYSAVWSLRNDVSDKDRIPQNKKNHQAERVGIAALVYLNYKNSQGGYDCLPDCDCPDKFYEQTIAELKEETDRWYKGTKPLEEIVFVKSEKIMADQVVLEKYRSEWDLQSASIRFVALAPG